MMRTLSILVLAASIAYGQTPETSPITKRNSIHVGVGILHTRQIDRGYTGSSLLFTGTNVPFRFGYLHEGTRQFFAVSTTLSFGKLKSKGGDLPSDFYYVELTSDYVRQVTKHSLFGKENQFFGGLRISTINQGVANISQIDNISVYSLHGAYVALNNRLKIDDKRSFHFTWFVPAIVYENRLLYNGGQNDITTKDFRNFPKVLSTHGHVTYLNIFRNVQVTMDYVMRLNKHVDASLRYRFFYASNSMKADYHTYSNELIASLHFRF